MLVSCPECNQRVSDQARACPGCGFPIAEHTAQQRAAERASAARQAREHIGTVDCVPCKARGFRQVPVDPENPEGDWLFEWCVTCDYTGRVALCQSLDGYYAVAVGYDHITRMDQNAADGNRLVNGFYFVSAGPDSTSAVSQVKINRNSFFDHLVRIPDAAVGNNTYRPFTYPE